jgi:F420-dependent oxidoreductase-like protein
VRIGIFTGPQNVSWPELRDVWLHADAHGYDSAWLWDHLVALHGDLDDPHFEAWTLLASLATVTSNVRIGHLVTANTFRHPAVLAKMAATVDHTSGGRLVVGIGTGYYAEEHTRYGIELPSKAERAERLAEAAQILRGMWAPGRFTFAGRHYRLTDAPAEPKPLQPGGPPILMGGAGERLMRNTALYADQWNLPDGAKGITPEHFRAKLDALQRVCGEVGRDPAEIESSTSMTVIVDEDARRARRRFEAFREYRGWDEETTARHTVWGTPGRVVEELGRWEAAGVQHFLVHLVPGVNYEDLELFSESVLPHIRS